MSDNGGAICVIGQKIKDVSEMEMTIPENTAKLKVLCAELNSLISEVE